ncbi:MAG: serine hydroxymethyltransferase, partial [Nitrosomonadales bacterium]|nr:serine hydroxymethyltransferase [Nitrosomonadales bacterium]
IPNDPESPFVTSGIRIGSPAITSRGFMEKEAALVGNFIADVLDDPDSPNNLAKVKSKVSKLTKAFPVYGG